MTFSNLSPADFAKLATISADLQAFDLPNGYKVVRKKIAKPQLHYVWHVVKLGWFVDANGHFGDSYNPGSTVHHQSIADAITAYEAHLLLMANPNCPYKGYFK